MAYSFGDDPNIGRTLTTDTVVQQRRENQKAAIQPTNFALRATNWDGPAYRHRPVQHEERHDEIDPVQAIMHNQMYGWEGTTAGGSSSEGWRRRGDPFDYVTAHWLEGGPRVHRNDAPVDQEEEMDEDQRAAAREELREREEQEHWEKERFHQMVEADQGHLLWLRGRDTRSELRPALRVAMDRDFMMRKKMEVSPRDMGAPDRENHHWFRVTPPQALGDVSGFNEKLAHRAKQTVHTYTPAPWCWRADFVADALREAAAQDLVAPVVDVAAARRAAKQNATVPKSLRAHVEAVCTDGRHQVWSAGFLQLLDLIMASRKLTGVVKVSLQAFTSRSPEAMFPPISFKEAAARERAKVPPGPKFMQVPRKLSEFRTSNSLPSLEPPVPAFPDRLPCRMCWRGDASFYHIIKPKEDAHEGTARPATQESSISYNNSRMGHAVPTQTRSMPAIPQLSALAGGAPSFNFIHTGSSDFEQSQDRQPSKASDRQVSKKSGGILVHDSSKQRRSMDMAVRFDDS